MRNIKYKYGKGSWIFHFDNSWNRIDSGFAVISCISFCSLIVSVSLRKTDAE